MTLSCRREARRQPEIDAEPASRRNSDQDEHQMPYVQIHSLYGESFVKGLPRFLTQGHE